MDLHDYAVEKGREGAGNWLRFESFAWRSDDRPDDAERWTIVYHTSRDADALTRANAAVIEEAMARHCAEGEDAREFSAGHWACGWVGGYAIRPFKPDTETPTEAWLTYCGMMLALADYPVLDEQRLGEEEQEEIASSWGCWLRYDVLRRLPEPLRDVAEELDDDALRGAFDDACSSSNSYPEVSGSEVIFYPTKAFDAVWLAVVREAVYKADTKERRQGAEGAR